MGDRWVVAVNPNAGKRPILLSRVERALAAVGIEAEVESPGSVGDMVRVISEAAVEERVAVVGGDGTVNLAVNTLLDQSLDRLPILGVLPAGTGCDLLRTFGISQRLEEAARHLLGTEVYQIDVGVLQGEWGTRRFANVAQAGVGAAAVVTSTRLPRWLGAQRYVSAFALRLPGFRRCEIRLTTPRRSYEGSALAVIMANAQFFAGGWNIAPKAMLVDGALDLQVIDVPKTAAPRLVPRIVHGLHLTESGVTRISSGSFQLETNIPWPVEVDGEPIGNTPVEGWVLPAALTLKI